MDWNIQRILPVPVCIVHEAGWFCMCSCSLISSFAEEGPRHMKEVADVFVPLHKGHPAGCPGAEGSIALAQYSSHGERVAKVNAAVEGHQ